MIVEKLAEWREVVQRHITKEKYKKLKKKLSED